MNAHINYDVPQDLPLPIIPCHGDRVAGPRCAAVGGAWVRQSATIAAARWRCASVRNVRWPSCCCTPWWQCCSAAGAHAAVIDVEAVLAAFPPFPFGLFAARAHASIWAEFAATGSCDSHLACAAPAAAGAGEAEEGSALLVEAVPSCADGTPTAWCSGLGGLPQRPRRRRGLKSGMAPTMAR
jgi:hypothetical protein